MILTPTHILLTGSPGVGKTTVIRSAVENLKDLSPVGFYTEEIRERGSRVGFQAVGVNGETQILAHVRFGGSQRIGRYGVDVKGFEEFLERLNLLNSESQLIIIDEIGKMECLSAKFNALVLSLFRSSKTILATIAKKGGGLIQQIKDRPDCQTVEINPKNRERIVNDIVERLKK